MSDYAKTCGEMGYWGQERSSCSPCSILPVLAVIGALLLVLVWYLYGVPSRWRAQLGLPVDLCMVVLGVNAVGGTEVAGTAELRNWRILADLVVQDMMVTGSHTA